MSTQKKETVYVFLSGVVFVAPALLVKMKWPTSLSMGTIELAFAIVSAILTALFFFTRKIFVHRLIPIYLWPFDYIETRWAWPGFFGYLIAVVVEKQIL
jgi:hypothetical protein